MTYGSDRTSSEVDLSIQFCCQRAGDVEAEYVSELVDGVGSEIAAVRHVAVADPLFLKVFEIHSVE